MAVRFQRCLLTHPLVVQAPLGAVVAPCAGAWLWDTLTNGDLAEDVEGRPTVAQCNKCTGALLDLGRLSFLSGSRDEFRDTKFERVEGLGWEAFVKRIPVFSRWSSIPTLVSTRCREASPDLFFAFGNWSMGSQVVLLMATDSRPDNDEREFLLCVSSGQTPTADLPNLLAVLVPMVDGCGVIAKSRDPSVIDDVDAVFMSRAP